MVRSEGRLTPKQAFYVAVRRVVLSGAHASRTDVGKQLFLASGDYAVVHNAIGPDHGRLCFRSTSLHWHSLSRSFVDNNTTERLLQHQIDLSATASMETSDKLPVLWIFGYRILEPIKFLHFQFRTGFHFPHVLSVEVQQSP